MEFESKKKLYDEKIYFVNDYYGYDEFELINKYKKSIQIDVYRDIIIRLQKYNNDLEEYFEKNESEINKMETIERLQKENEELKNKISNQDNDIIYLNKKINQLEKTLEENKKEKESLKDKLQETNYQHEKTVNDYNKRLKEKEYIKTNMNEFIKTFKENEELEEKNKTLKEGNDYLKEIIELQKTFILKVKENKDNHKKLINIIDEKE